MTKSIITVTLFILTALGSWDWVDEDWVGAVGDVEIADTHWFRAYDERGCYFLKIRSARLRGFVHFGSRVHGGKSVGTKKCLHPRHPARFWFVEISAYSSVQGLSCRVFLSTLSRHIDIRKHYLRDLCLSGIVKLIPSRTHHMVADALTTSLPALARAPQ
jgi:hypothetical protein